MIEAHVPMPFEHALLSLDDGRRLRAAGDRPAAVAQLEKAHRLFSGLGADPYVQACATELAALQVTAATGSPAALLGLSRAELAVARLVATGLTNREVASQLYVSVKTVEYHLRNSYIKLDITSRRALAASGQLAAPGAGHAVNSQNTGSNLGSHPGDNTALPALTVSYGRLTNAEADDSPSSRYQPDSGRTARRTNTRRRHRRLEAFLRRARVAQSA